MTNTETPQSEHYCSSCEEDMSADDYAAKLSARDLWERVTGVEPECDDCMDAKRDAWLEHPYG